MELDSITPMTQQDRAVIKYYGGKWNIAKWISDRMPPHRVYVEPYCGGASVFFQKEIVAEREILNDLNGDIVNLFRVLREQPEKLINALELTPYSREEFQLSYEPTSDPVEQARRYMVRCGQGKVGSRKSVSAWKVRSQSFGYSELPDTWSNWDSLPKAIKRLKHAAIENRSALEVIKLYDTPVTLHYVDPPYVISARREQAKNYQHEMTDKDHRELAAVLHGVSGMVMLSGYDSPLYQELYGDWTSYRVEANTIANIAAHEVLWLNPAAAAINTLPLFANLPKADAP